MAMAIPVVVGAIASGTAYFGFGASAAVALGIGGFAMSAVSALTSGMQQSSMYKYNAAVARRNAEAAQQAAAYDAEVAKRKGQALMSSQEAMFASRGIVGTEGSPLEFMAGQAKQIEMDRQTILYRGSLDAMRYEGQAVGAELGADNAFKAGLTNAGTSLLKGAATAASSLDFPSSSSGGVQYDAVDGMGAVYA